MKEHFKELYCNFKDTMEHGLEKARSSRLLSKSLIGLAGIIAAAAILILFFKAMGYLFDSIYSFIDRHFFGVAASCAGGSYLIYRHNEKKLEQKKISDQQRAGLDNQKARFVKGCYNRVGQFIFANICTAPNFTDLTSCSRPTRPEDMGNERIDAYCIQGVMYLRYSLPKMTVENLDTHMIASVMQGLIDQKIKTGGLNPFIAAGDNHYLYVDKIDDMQTYVSLTLVLNFDDTYIQQVAFQNAMSDVVAREQLSRSLEDSDY